MNFNDLLTTAVFNDIYQPLNTKEKYIIQINQMSKYIIPMPNLIIS